MNDKFPAEAKRIMNDRFRKDSLIAVATLDGNVPCVRTVNSYYEDGCFYTVTYALSGKMRQIAVNPVVAVCGDWFTGHGVGENLGWIRAEKNADIANKLRTAFASWYSNGHTNEEDVNTVILRIRLTDGVLLHHGTRFDIDFT